MVWKAQTISYQHSAIYFQLKRRILAEKLALRFDVFEKIFPTLYDVTMTSQKEILRLRQFIMKYYIHIFTEFF